MKRMKLSEEALEASSEKVEKSAQRNVRQEAATTKTPAKRKKAEAPDEDDVKVKDRRKNHGDGSRVFQQQQVFEISKTIIQSMSSKLQTYPLSVPFQFAHHYDPFLPLAFTSSS